MEGSWKDPTSHKTLLLALVPSPTAALRGRQATGIDGCSGNVSKWGNRSTDLYPRNYSLALEMAWLLGDTSRDALLHQCKTSYIQTPLYIPHPMSPYALSASLGCLVINPDRDLSTQTGNCQTRQGFINPDRKLSTQTRSSTVLLTLTQDYSRKDVHKGQTFPKD